MFSKACEYAIRAVLYLSVKSVEGARFNIKAIAKAIDSPEAFTAKILQKLVRKKIVASHTGPGGGFCLAPSARQLPINEIIVAIDGGEILRSCVLGLRHCSDVKPCPIHLEVKTEETVAEAIVETVEA